MKKQNGFTVVEMIVAMTLLVIIVFAFAPALAFYYKQITVASQGEQHIFDVNEDLNEQLALRARDGADNPFDLTFSGPDITKDIDGKVFGTNLTADGVTTFEAAAVDAEGRVRFGISVKPSTIVAAYDGVMTVTATFKLETPAKLKLVDKTGAAVSGAVFKIINNNEAELSGVAFLPDKSPYTVIYNGLDENGMATDFKSSFEISPYPYMVATADGQYYYGSLNTAGDLKLIDMNDQIASGTPGGGSKMGASDVSKPGAATPERPRIVSDLIWDGRNYIAGAIGVLDEQPPRSDSGDFPPRLAVMNDLSTWKTLKDLGANTTQNRIYETRCLVPLINGGFAVLGRYLAPEKYNRITLMNVTDSGVNVGDILGSPDLLHEGLQYKDGAKTLLIDSDLNILAGQHKEWADKDDFNFNRGIILVNIDGVDIDFKEIVSGFVSTASQYLPGKTQDASNYAGYYTGGDVGSIDGKYGFIFTTYKRWVNNGSYEPGAIIALTLDADEVKFDLSLGDAYDVDNNPLVNMQSFGDQYGYNDIVFGNGTVVANSANQTENWIVVGERGLILYRDKSNVNRFQQTTRIYDGGTLLEDKVRETLQFTRAAFYEGSFYAMGYRGEVSHAFADDGSRNATPAHVADGEYYAVLYQSKDGGRTWYKVAGLNSGFEHSDNNTYATEVVGIAMR
ncbi:MAG: prepilin-type N-terminal cleavage/methylation domain-containing protein [Gracilibacteraceae bacterium]|jgi:prepilin-type N-terminal cleavage/methylation domain-containing protein|nr:prepilin-type N-terminal cleavage/methylation domain-containing protein [Gracilibacteraceae bacterium]